MIRGRRYSRYHASPTTSVAGQREREPGCHHHVGEHARKDGQEDYDLQDSSRDGTEVRLEDVDEGILGLTEQVAQAVRDRDEEADDHEQAGRHRDVVGPDHGERGDGSGVVGLLGQVRGPFPADEAVQREQRRQDEAVPEGPA